jgi:hypothetical protein
MAATEVAYPPLYLSREEAARYVGVSATLFDQEVERGLWPKGVRRGAKGGRVTWYRLGLEAAAEARTNGGGHDTKADFDAWRASFAAGREDRPKAARGRR